MHLYHLTLQRGSHISLAVHGNFAGTKQQEIALAKGKVLELVRPDPATGKVHSLLSVDIFGVIRSMIAFRLTGGSKDYLVIGSDSGRIIILEYMPLKNCFEKVCLCVCFYEMLIIYALFRFTKKHLAKVVAGALSQVNFWPSIRKDEQ